MRTIVINFLAILIFIITLGVSAVDNKTIAKWDFQSGKIEEAGQRFIGKLRGETTLGQDSEGNPALIMGKSEITKPSGLYMDNIYKELTPNVAFSLEVGFCLNSKTSKQLMTLWDNKYIIFSPKPDNNLNRSHHGFSLLLRKSGVDWVPQSHFGYGNSSLTFTGKKISLNDGKYHTLRLEYSPDEVRFLIDGNLNHSQPTRAPGSLSSAVFPTAIGDRVGSSYYGFEGTIASVTLQEMAKKEISISQGGRVGFIRLESNPELLVLITNISEKDLCNLQVSSIINEYPEIQLPKYTIDLKKGMAETIKLPMNAKLKPGIYHFKIKAGGVTESIEVRVVSERINAYPVVMWGVGNNKKLSDLGFTHSMAQLGRRNPSQTDLKKILKGLNMLDSALNDDIYLIENFCSNRDIQERFPRIGRDGKPYKRLNLEASNPEAQAILVKIADNTAAIYGHHPAFAGAMIQSEVRDGSNPSFTGIEEQAYKKYSGRDIPLEVNSRNAPGYRSITGFPVMRVIPEDYPLLQYYSWFWRIGDGWNPLHSAISKALHKGSIDTFWTFHDPAVRVPPQWGSGGDVDCISQWSYTSADPIKIGQSADEMLAMQGGNSTQMVMKMTQAFWYRNQSAPLNKKVENPPEWLKEYPDAKFISISPDHLRIALWSKIARKLDGIMYHGYQSLVEPVTHASYRFTNPGCAIALKDLTENVIKPLGPLLKKIPERRPKMAILQSFSTTIFAPDNASFGWGRGWNADIHLALQWAQYQPAIIYEEHIKKGILDQVEVLVLPAIEVLPESVFNAILKFQNQGGIVIGDNLLVPGIMPDIIIDVTKRVIADPSGTKTKLQALGASIRKQLSPHFRSYCEGNNPDIVPRMRSWEKSDYLFVVNDRRTFGDYVGQWGMIMEKGIPTEGLITVNRQAGAVYDLISNRQVEFKSTSDNCIIPVKLEAGGGCLFLITERPFGKTTVGLPEQATLGATFQVNVEITDNAGEIAEALVPLEVKLLNSENEVMPGSGYFCAENGTIKIDFTASINELAGTWKIIVKNLADGKMVNAKLGLNK